MTQTVLIQIREEPTGGWRVAIGDGRTRAVEAILTADRIGETCRSIAEALAATSPVLVRGRDASRSRAEERAGQLLGGLLTAPPELGGRWSWLLGRAAGQQQAVQVVVDATDPAARGLPWELLAGPDGLCLEESGDGVVLRLAPGSPGAAAVGSGLSIRTWCADPTDPVCASRLEALGRLVGDLSLPVTAGDAIDGTTELLWVIGHGERLEEGVCLALEHAEQGPGTAAHALGPDLRRAGLVVLDVCEAGSPTRGELDALAARLVTAGAQACAGPLVRTGLEAADAFAQGLLEALIEGSDLAGATAAGRREVRGLALPHPDCRWANQALWVSGIDVLEGPLVRVERRPTSWPRPGAEISGLVGEAMRLAASSSGGFVGVEHLLSAVATSEHSSPGTAALRYALAREAEAWRRHLNGLTVDPARADGLAATPRLARIGWWLPEGFALEDLAQELSKEPGDVLGYLLGTFPTKLPTGDSTLQSATWGWESTTEEEAVALEVLGGPEDGRRLRPAEGESLGRAASSDGPHHGLYVATRLVDPYLSRRHLRWDGDGRITALRPLARVRGGDACEVQGSVPVRAGDILRLTDATSLRLLSAATLGA